MTKMDSQLACMVEEKSSFVSDFYIQSFVIL